MIKKHLHLGRSPRIMKWSTWRILLTTVLLIGIGLIAWRAIFPVMDTGADNKIGGQPIATLDSPDFHSLLVDPQDPNHIMFGSHAGIQESYDGGFTWQTGNLRNVDVMQLASSPNAPRTIYATGHDVFQISRDGGQSWQPQVHNLPGSDIHGFAQDSAQTQRLYAFIVGRGVLTSVDGGMSWVSIANQPPGSGAHVALASGDGVVYAARDMGIAVSEDSDQFWSMLPTQPSSQVISMALPTNDSKMIYVGTVTGLIKSTDGGISWMDLGPNEVPVLAFAVTPTNPDRVFVVSDEGALYRSDDGGVTWRST
jgi:photosystem II stability/assembly factor-like uncharacterized protein